MFKLGELVSSRKCPVLRDINWLLGGVYRVLHDLASGRDYLQMIAANMDGELEALPLF